VYPELQQILSYSPRNRQKQRGIMIRGICMSRLVTYSVVGLMSLFGGLALAQSPEPIQVDIGAQPVGDALNQFAEQSGLQVVLYADDAKGIDVAGVSGEFNDATLALDRLLASTGLEYSFINDRTVAVASVRKVAEEGGDSNPGNGRTAGATPRPVMMAQAVERSQTSQRAETDSAEDVKKRPLEEIIVTGTNIRGVAPESSPLQSYGRDEILGSGITTTEQFIRKLPQNYNGGSSEFISNGLPNDSDAGANTGFGNGANLRGLGSGATLTLLNGNRLAPSSTIGDFVDVSMIPISALERVEVLTDGGSSIYGGDAVAGVVNLILRDDFDGAETAVRYGTVTKEHMEEYRVGQTFGKAWRSGHALATYEFFHRDNLTLADRPDLTPSSLPNGEPATATSFHYLLPEHMRHSAVVSLNQEIATNLDFDLTGLYSERSTKQSTLRYSNDGLFDTADIDAQTALINAALDYQFLPDWSVRLGGSYSEVSQSDKKFLGSGNIELSSIDSSAVSIDLLVNGRLFDLPGGSVRAAFGTHYREEDFENVFNDNTAISRANRDVSALFGELSIPLVGRGNAVDWVQRLEVNLSGRMDDYSDFGTTTNPKVGVLWAPSDNLKLRTSYSESFSPPPLGRVGTLTRTGDVFPTSLVASITGFSGQYPELEAGGYFIVSGTAPDLDAQTSRSHTAGFDYTKDFGSSDFSVSASYYDIAFDNRLGRVPVPQNLNAINVPFLAYEDPSLFPDGTVIFFPSQTQVQNLIDTLSEPPGEVGGATLDNVTVINYAQQVRNLASVDTSGVDMQFNYAAETPQGARVAVGLNANYILSFDQQAASTTPNVETLDTLYNPVGLKLRGSFGISNGGYSATAFVNYVGDYQTDNTAAAKKIDSWTTVDLVASYVWNEEAEGPLRNTTLSLSASNLFDQAPPKTTTFGSFRLSSYDPTNADPVGRFIAIELRKSF
jgi:outer membrane receptor protein involved in Fe transport